MSVRIRRVHFADSVGKALTACTEFAPTDAPTCIGSPNSTTTACDEEDYTVAASRRRSEPIRKYLQTRFTQPACLPNFWNRLEANTVLLENIVTRSPMIYGTIIVKNLAFEKKIKMRYTLNGWVSFREVEAHYANSCCGIADRFSFSLSVPNDFGLYQRLLFAISYKVDGQTYWDNNSGINYCIECVAHSSSKAPAPSSTSISYASPVRSSTPMSRSVLLSSSPTKGMYILS